MTTFSFITLDKSSSVSPLYRQIYEAIRRAILQGQVRSGLRLPPTRQLAGDLGISRMTVINAYEQLFSEGYLEGKTGSGTFVAASLPEEYLRVATTAVEKIGQGGVRSDVHLSGYGKYIAKNLDRLKDENSASKARPFQHSLSAVNEFPWDIWGKIAQKKLGYGLRDLGGYGDPAGYLPLRKAIAEHLRSARGVVCDDEQVIITSGIQQAVFLIGRVLIEPGEKVWFEDPSHLCAVDVIESGGADILRVPVDDDGFDLSRAKSRSKDARLVYVTPSRQFPLGMTMTLERRLNLLEWASEGDRWIVEDDYDSEFRYSGRPLASLQGLDRHGRVLYLGTFSKTIFPGLRIGCMVVPPGLIELFAAARALTDLHGPLTDQMILAEFIAEGHFERHIRRMRTLYRERQEILASELDKHLSGVLDVPKNDAGMHTIAWLPKGIKDTEISKLVSEGGVQAAPISKYAHHKLDRGGLILGYTAFDERQIRSGVKKLTRILEPRLVG